MKKLKPIQKLISLLTAVAFMTGSLGFIGCGGIDEDPAAADIKEVVDDPENEDGQVDIDEAEEDKAVINDAPDDPSAGADGDDGDE